MAAGFPTYACPTGARSSSAGATATLSRSGSLRPSARRTRASSSWAGTKQSHSTWSAGLPLLGRVRLRTLEPEHIQHALGKLLDRGLAARTVRQVHMVLRCSLKQAVLWRLIPSNPSDAVKPPRAERKKMRTLSEDEVRRLLAATTGTRHHTLWVFLVTTGVRLGEALALRWADVDLVEGHATIRRALQRQRG